MPVLSVHIGDRELITAVPSDFTPDEVFVACNRIVDLHSDLARLGAEWQRQLRTQLDDQGARSLSVGDCFAVPRAGCLAVWVVAASGFHYGEAVPGRLFDGALLP